MKRADKISGMILIAFFLFMFYQSTKLDMMYRNSPGAGFFPLWLSILAILAATIVVVGAFRKPELHNLPVPWPKSVGLRRIGLTFVSFLLYVYLMTVLGFIISTIAYVMFMSRMLGSRRWFSSIAVSVLTPLALYLVFKVWLQMELPTGLLKMM